MYEKLESCPSCKSAHSKNHLIVSDHSISKEDFALIQCQNCSLIYTSPRPDSAYIWKYYQDEKYISHSNKVSTIRDIIYKLIRKITLAQKHRLIQTYNKSKGVLDFGVGTGHFLSYLKTKNYKVTGVEPSPEANTQMPPSLKTHIVSSLSDLPGKTTYDIITAWHVIEHVHELRSTLKQLKKKLNKEGIFVMALPNPKSWDANHYQEFWAGYDVPRHLYHFSQAAVKSLAKEMKLRVVAIHPMKFDAFYVSMLSEQYKGSSNSFIKGIVKGWQSNRSAKNTGEYSSLIYIIKK